MILAFTNSKGGVGKSTLAVHFAVWLSEQGKRVALVDSDGQSSSSVWLKEAAPEIMLHRLLAADDVLAEIPHIATEFDHVVVDGPGGLSEATRAILCLADITFVPCGPTVLDLRGSMGAIEIVRELQGIRNGPPVAVLVPNKLQRRYRLSTEFLDTARSLDISTSGGLRFLKNYADAAGQGTVVWRLKGKAAREAGAEIRALFVELLSHGTAQPALDERGTANA